MCASHHTIQRTPYTMHVKYTPVMSRRCWIQNTKTTNLVTRNNLLWLWWYFWMIKSQRSKLLKKKPNKHLCRNRKSLGFRRSKKLLQNDLDLWPWAILSTSIWIYHHSYAEDIKGSKKFAFPIAYFNFIIIGHFYVSIQILDGIFFFTFLCDIVPTFRPTDKFLI